MSLHAIHRHHGSVAKQQSTPHTPNTTVAVTENQETQWHLDEIQRQPSVYVLSGPATGDYQYRNSQWSQHWFPNDITCCESWLQRKTHSSDRPRTESIQRCPPPPLLHPASAATFFLTWNHVVVNGFWKNPPVYLDLVPMRKEQREAPLKSSPEL